MSQKGPITINDGQATPVATTFNVESENGNVYTFAERSAGVSVGFKRLTASTTFATKTGAVNRAKFAVELPVISVVNGVSSVAYTLRANVDTILPVASTDQDRKNLYAFLS